MEKNIIVIGGPKNFCFNFDWLKYVHENLKQKTEFILKKQGIFS